MIAGVLFAAYLLGLLIHGVLTFKDCPEEAEALQQAGLLLCLIPEQCSSHLQSQTPNPFDRHCRSLLLPRRTLPPGAC